MQKESISNNSCLELRISNAYIQANRFEHLATGLQALGTSEETDVDSGEITHIAWFAVDENMTQQRAHITAAALLLNTPAEAIEIKLLGDDWATAWHKHWTGIAIGKQLWVRPPFCDAPQNERIDIILDPGQAFGTGSHPTTHLCLECIERYCDKHTPQSLLDMGAGSGLLAIAAGKLGAKGIVAIDYDPLSVEASAVNAKINGVSLQSLLGDTPPPQRFELVVANILADPLLDMAEKLTACVENTLILSGLLSTQVHAIIHAYEQAGLTHHKTWQREEWAAVEFNKPF